MAQTITTEMVRVALRVYAQGGQTVSNAQLYEALGLETDVERQRMRTRVTDMIGRGEVERVGTAMYQYNFSFRLRDASAAQGYSKMWRYVRKEKSGWRIKDCALMVGLNVSYVTRYIDFLYNNGFVEIVGTAAHKTKLWRATQKAASTPETPLPQYTETDPFERERAAGARIVRTLLCGDLYAPKSCQTILDACSVLMARFSTKNENETI